MRTRLAAALAALIVLAGCGYIGDTLPPALNIPVPVTDLRALEYGENLVIEFTAPALSTEAVGLKALRGVELRVGPGIEQNFNVERWAPGAKRVEVAVTEPGAVRKEIPAREFAGKEIFVAVRAIGPKGRPSAWSNIANIHVIAPLQKPAALEGKAGPDGVHLSWTSPHAKFRIYRATRAEPAAQLAEADGASYVDTTAEFDTPYGYFVQAIADKAQSEVSETVSLTPKDEFAPAIPTGLNSAAGVGTVELNWERNIEPDLRGYRVYRAPEGAGFARISDIIETPVYSDRTAEPGKKYRYAVTSVDLKDNESKPSAAVEITAPEKP